MHPTYTESAHTTTDLFTEKIPNYAGFWRRFAAALIDGLLLSGVGKLLQLGGAGEQSAGLASLVLNWLYFALMESSERQATLGKMALGLRVTNLDGGRISFGQGTGRYFGRILSAIILFIGYFMMLWDDKKQTLHDKMANTLVVEQEG